ncbi:hypothetical protein EWE75_21185 [Sphingomonas populi]|uniref:Uncharacterized protein n=1 Tax=Sphingomonas populi TaxID=2484750 RepID=A0A4Q6XT98_9SPHN|nr:hypothetical protein [Sphingomonas populi]RZF60782.1 hypothetical protein EWE75_21185 [Sphingomonas populi]
MAGMDGGGAPGKSASSNIRLIRLSLRGLIIAVSSHPLCIAALSFQEGAQPTSPLAHAGIDQNAPAQTNKKRAILAMT